MGKIYTRSDRKGAKTIPFGLGGGGGTHTYIAYIREYPTPFPPGIAGVYFRKTSVIYLGWDLAVVRIFGVSARRELIVADGDAALVIDDIVAKLKDDDNKYDAAFSIIIITVK